jgi:hypothetical protein
MNDSLLHTIVIDYRTYLAAAIGFGGVALSSRRQDERWRVLGREISAQQAALSLPFFILISVFFLSGLQFDWSGEFASGILCAFGLAFSLKLFNFHARLIRGTGLLFVLFYSYGVYGIIHTWISRADHGHPYR